MIQNNLSHKSKKVIVAISGGVDSAVAAALLQEKGLDVVGVFFDFGDWGKSGLRNAKKIAKKLGIPLKIVNARMDFKKKIIDYFVKAYKSGVTPNPCVVCNKEMKFNLLFKLLKKYKADYVATGHYARLRREFSIFNFQFSNNSKIYKCQNIKLLEAKDKSKDQSYFLYRLTRKDLSKIIFPLGDYKKVEVKKMAMKLGLPVAEEESQDICFLLDSDINSFLKKYLKPNPGNIVDEKGNSLGKHKGLPFYTIGQRKGIEIGGTGPFFVIAKNGKKNQLIVSNDPKKLLMKIFEVGEVNWLDKTAKLPMKVKIQIRYHAEKIPAIIKAERAGLYTILAKKNLRGATPGQSAVFYQNDEVLGGGIIS